MIRILLIIMFVIGVDLIVAQTYNMKIKQNSGTTYLETGTIDEISFNNTATNPFVCGDVILYGGETYPTVQIGVQCWFQKNLNIGTRIDGANNQTDNSIVEKYCYDDKPSNCVTFGGLYQWNEAMQYVTTAGTKGICPTGWHIATNAENTTLKTFVGNDGNGLKAMGQGTGAGPGTNTSGFSALLAGYRDYNSTFNYLGSYTYFCSSTEISSTNAYTLSLLYNDSNILLNSINKEYGFSVRCVKD